MLLKSFLVVDISIDTVRGFPIESSIFCLLEKHFMTVVIALLLLLFTAYAASVSTGTACTSTTFF